MSEQTGMSMGVRVKLSAMMFLQYMMIAVWWVPLAAYLSANLGLTGAQLALVLNAMAFGCLASPIIGAIADRHFASQYVLAALNLVGGLLLIFASTLTAPMMIFWVVLVQMLCYMPTWGLTSAIAMAHSPSEEFPRIRVFGSIGWVASGVFSVVALKLFSTSIDTTAIPMICGGVTSLVGAALALTLPHTPPPAKGEKASLVDILGLRAIVLMKSFSFTVFIVVALLMMIPFSIYWSYCSLFLNDQGFELLTFTMNLGQFAEMFFMVLVTVALTKVGLKWAMAFGLIALLVRYVAFYYGSLHDVAAMYYVGILVHGIIFGFFFVGGQIYIDRKAPKQIQAQAQGFFFLITMGIGLMVGNFYNSNLINQNSTVAKPVAAEFKLSEGPLATSDMIEIEGASVSDLRLYDRILNDYEFQTLVAGETKQKNLAAEAKAKDIVIDLDKGLLGSGDLAALDGKQPTSPMTISGDFVIPAPPEGKTHSGTLIRVGDGESAIRVHLRESQLVLTAGDAEIHARTVAVPMGKNADSDEDQPIRIAATFDGEKVALRTGGDAYRMYNWAPIWLNTTIWSLAILVAFVLLFHDAGKEDKEEEASPPAEEA